MLSFRFTPKLQAERFHKAFLPASAEMDCVLLYKSCNSVIYRRNFTVTSGFFLVFIVFCIFVLVLNTFIPCMSHYTYNGKKIGVLVYSYLNEKRGFMIGWLPQDQVSIVSKPFFMVISYVVPPKFT